MPKSQGAPCHAKHSPHAHSLTAPVPAVHAAGAAGYPAGERGVHVGLGCQWQGTVQPRVLLSLPLSMTCSQGSEQKT